MPHEEIPNNNPEQSKENIHDGETEWDELKKVPLAEKTEVHEENAEKKSEKTSETDLKEKVIESYDDSKSENKEKSPTPTLIDLAKKLNESPYYVRFKFEPRHFNGYIGNITSPFEEFITGKETDVNKFAEKILDYYEDDYGFAENLPNLIALGAEINIDEAVKKIEKTSESCIIENIDKFMAAGANIDLQKKIKKWTDECPYTVADNLNKFKELGVEVDIKRLDDIMFKRTPKQRIAKFIDRLF